MAARAPGTLSSPTPRAADVHAPHNVVGARGSEVSLGRFLQDQLVQCQVRHCSLQAPVLALELLQAPCLAHLHPAVLPPPPVVRLLGDAQLPADQLHGFAAGQTDLCLPQCSDDLLRSVSLPSHPDLLAEKLQTRSILTLLLVSFQGVRSYPASVDLITPPSTRLSLRPRPTRDILPGLAAGILPEEGSNGPSRSPPAWAFFPNGEGWTAAPPSAARPHEQDETGQCRGGK